MARSILAEETIGTASGRLLVAGPWARASRIVDPSYSSPADLLALARVDRRQAGRWAALAATEQRAISSLVGNGQLPPDWARATAHGKLVPSGTPNQPHSAPRYSFDAARVPIRYAGACRAQGRGVAAALWPTLDQAGSPTPYALTLRGQALTHDSHPGTRWLAPGCSAR